MYAAKKIAEPGKQRKNIWFGKDTNKSVVDNVFLAFYSLFILSVRHWGDGPLLPPRAMGVSASWTRVGRHPATRACPAIPPLTVPSSSVDPVPR
jgi:hypothetical protein